MSQGRNRITRREFFERTTGALLLLPSLNWLTDRADPRNNIFWVKNVPGNPFAHKLGRNRHAGIECLLRGMGNAGLKFYRSRVKTEVSGPGGMIARDDVVLVKVNAQWKYRGCTNSDLIRGLVQRILEHPDGFSGEVVLIDNGQGYGSLNCDTTHQYVDSSIHANANNQRHSFQYLVRNIFKDDRVSSYLLDPISANFIGDADHTTDGYRRFEDVSYPCFTTEGGRRVELLEGLWTGQGYSAKLKLINVPVLKHHDFGGSEITACLKHTYGLLSMSDGNRPMRHYSGLGQTCGKMIGCVRPPVLNILDAIWVSHLSLRGYPAGATRRMNQILASQDPAALDYWAAKYVLYPIDNNSRHHPNFEGINRWLTAAVDLINSRGHLYRPAQGILVKRVTKTETQMQVFRYDATKFLRLPATGGA